MCAGGACRRSFLHCIQLTFDPNVLFLTLISRCPPSRFPLFRPCAAGRRHQGAPQRHGGGPEDEEVEDEDGGETFEDGVLAGCPRTGTCVCLWERRSSAAGKDSFHVFKMRSVLTEAFSTATVSRCDLHASVWKSGLQVLAAVTLTFLKRFNLNP